MEPLLLRGETVRLAAINPETDSATSETWSLNAEFQKFYDSRPARPRTAKSMHDNMAASQAKDEPSGAEFSFNIRTLADDRLIGESNLDVPSWPNRDAWVAIGLGLSADWGRGYGTDAMRLLLRYAFAELNLERVSLFTFGFNERAQRSYLKAGFKLEGRQRECLRRDDRRWDDVYMGILRDEWFSAAGS
jgi:RimJ/RimL family protein N-acetyltransferase